MKRSKEKNSVWLMFLASFMWGSSFVGSKICLNSGMQPFETVFYRMLIGTAAIALLFHKQLRHFHPAALRSGLAVGLVTCCVYTAEMYGIAMIETTKASFLASTNIVMMPFLAAFFLKNKLQARSFIAALIALSGVAVMSFTGGESLSIERGDTLLLIAALGYAMGSIVVVKFGEGAPPVQVTFLQLFVTMVYTGVMTLLQGHGGNYPPQTIGALLYLAIGPTFICFLIKNYALQYLSPMKCTLILSTESVFCAVLSVAILHDEVTVRMLVGIVLIILGISTENFGSFILEKLKGKKSQLL